MKETPSPIETKPKKSIFDKIKSLGKFIWKVCTLRIYGSNNTPKKQTIINNQSENNNKSSVGIVLIKKNKCCETVIKITAPVSGIGNTGTAMTGVANIFNPAFKLLTYSQPINPYDWCLSAINLFLCAPSFITSSLIGYANSLEFKKFIKNFLNESCCKLIIETILLRLPIAAGNFFYNALLNNYSAFLKAFTDLLLIVGIPSMAWPVLLAIIILQSIGTMTNLPVWDEVKKMASELYQALKNLPNHKCTYKDLGKLLLAAVSIGLAVFTDIPYFFAAYLGFARFGGKKPAIWLKALSAVLATLGGIVDVALVSKTIYKTVAKIFDKKISKECCSSWEKPLAILLLSFTGGMLVWQMGVVKPEDIEKTIRQLFGKSKIAEDTFKIITKYMSPFAMTLGGTILVNDKIDRPEVNKVLDDIIAKLSCCKSTFFNRTQKGYQEIKEQKIEKQKNKIKICCC
ncbi:MAG: hypothetical protein PVI75_07690 [Gammaproteobacteria bacterium]|jgi:hypothetical protein